ncbi:MAG: hypothetical protein GY719_16325 [bacterium]|nr:hypothetical protein [bacterium]
MPRSFVEWNLETAGRHRLGVALAVVSMVISMAWVAVPSSAQDPVLDAERRLRLRPPMRATLPPTPERAAAAQVPAVGGAWTRLGAAPILNGQVASSPRKEVAGAVEVVVAHPSDADVLWIGTVNGGVFRTENASAPSPIWTPLAEGLGALSVGALDLDPASVAGASDRDATPPNGETAPTLVFGVGRTSSFGSFGSPRRGLFRSTDGGDSWTPLDPGMAGRNIAGVATRGEILIACADNADSGFVEDTGLFRSIDAGVGFGRLAGGSGVPSSAFCLDLAGDLDDPARLYAALVDISGSEDGIYASENTGETWRRISPATTNSRLGGASGAELAVGGGAGVLYAAICTGGRLAEVSRTADGGASWTLMGLPLTTEDAVFGAHPGGQCPPHLSLAAHPKEASVVFVGGDRQPSATENAPRPSFPNSIGADDFGARLFRGELTPQGTQWTSLAFCPPGVTTPACGTGRPADGSAPHADSRAMTFNADGELVETDDGGIYAHTDPDGTGGTWRTLNGSLSINEQHDVAYDPIAGIAISGNQDNGSANQRTPDDPAWILQAFGDGGDVAVGANDPAPGLSMRYFSSQSLQGALRAAFDADNNFVAGSARRLRLQALDAIRIAPQFVTPMVIHGADPTRIVFGGGNGVFESRDRGDTTRRISTDRVNAFGGRAICYGTASNPDVLYYGAGGDVFARSSPPPASPTRSLSYPGDRVIGCALDPDDARHVFVIDGSRVFESRDGGAAWDERSGDLSALEPGVLRSVAFVPSPGGDPAGDRLVVGGGEGVFIAFAATDFSIWQPLGSDLPPAPVFELVYDATDDALLAGTLGRGAYLLTPVRALALPTP